MHSFKILILLSLLLVSVEAYPAPEADSLIHENDLLKAELQLAKSSKIYIILDLEARKVVIKSRGVVLKELLVDSYSQWGTPVRPRPLPLLRKTALVIPERKEIIPSTQDSEDPSEPQVLQLDDMPLRYELEFDDGIQISVKPKSTGVISAVFNLIASLKSYLITRPFGSLWNGLRRKSFTEIILSLSENDARMLYWSFQEGFQCIIWSEPPAWPLPQNNE
jgi:hypothetical protein